MRAAQLVQPRTWKLIEVDRPEASNGNMLVRLERVAICGTDMPSFWGGYPSYPLQPGDTGHEGMGIVEACPSGRYAEGERVLLSHFDRGLFQEYVLARDDGVVRLPAGGRPEVVLMSQLLGTVIHCFYKLGNLINKDVVVIGQGPVGQLFNACLRNLGARRIVAVDPNRHRLRVAGQMGATHAIDPAEDVRAAVTDLTGGEMADCAVEAVGAAETLNLAAGLLKRGGTLVSFGVPDKDNHEGDHPARVPQLVRQRDPPHRLGGARPAEGLHRRPPVDHRGAPRRHPDPDARAPVRADPAGVRDRLPPPRGGRGGQGGPEVLTATR